MANKMTSAQMKEAAKKEVLEKLKGIFDELGAERYGSDYEVAVPTTVEGQEIWVGIVLTAKQYTKTKVSDPFDPFELRQSYDEAKAIKEKEKAEAAAKKKKKIEKDTARREAEKVEEVE